MNMDVRKIVVIVEDLEVSRTALQWALHNFLLYGDLVILLHVFPNLKPRSNNKKLRNLRLKGFQLALTFQDLCNNYPNTKTEIVVTEGDSDGGKIAAVVREIGASALVVGLHDHSFLYKMAMAENNIASNLNCKVLAIKQPTSLTTTRKRTISLPDSSTNMDFSQIEISSLSVPEVGPPRIPYQVCPDPHAIIWRTGRSRRWTIRD
ncbi:uncharacterized protein LOC107802190 [Nicotiana tabacum]|uniref:Uncharacterized protein LOC107802190 n=1 Tax=Nicotiana tabacum TaxID=4097 RepID=A0A1S4AWR1_TOBAC|nr:PREDICTED: uncharacterized protein LOC107802190 [Nicotiana tabacum]